MTSSSKTNASSPDSAQLQLAFDFHARGQLDKARLLYEMVLKEAPQNFPALYHLGLLESAGGNLSVATQCFRSAVESEPAHADALNNLGYLLQVQGEPDEALTFLERAVQAAPKDADIRINLGLLFKSLGRLTDALAQFDAVLAGAPNHLPATVNKANVLQQLARYEDALACYDHALVLNPGSAEVLANRCNPLRELGRLEEARQSAEAAVKAKPSFAAAWAELANVQREMGNRKEALNSFDQALVLDPELLRAHVNRASTALGDDLDGNRSIELGRQSLLAHLRVTFGDAATRRGVVQLPYLRLKHDWQQAQYQLHRGVSLPGVEQFVEVASSLLAGSGPGGKLSVSTSDFSRLQPYLSAYHVHDPDRVLAHCLNPHKNWREVEEQYFSSSPEIIHIDNFLSEEALHYLRDFCWLSKVWQTDYVNGYLGAFANQGFISAAHLQLARELKQKLPRIFAPYALNQLWGFKYEPTVTRGINVHADFARVNLNFWITASEHNLRPECGGLKVYDAPAPTNWHFEKYNNDTQAIYDYLAQRDSGCVVVPHRANRAVLFNSALFHETDEVHFAEGYESRRINLTYLFGEQLR